MKLDLDLGSQRRFGYVNEHTDSATAIRARMKGNSRASILIVYHKPVQPSLVPVFTLHQS
jgi:hypothetical protein